MESTSGLPLFWVNLVILTITSISLYLMFRPVAAVENNKAYGLPPYRTWNVTRLPGISLARLFSVGIFIFLIYAGLKGSQIPQQNAATVVVWLIWWVTIILLIPITGSLWCSICPWDNLGNWILKLSGTNTRLHKRVPAILRSLWPATLLFVAFSWLELGLGITASPYATSIFALGVFLAAFTFMTVFERKAFCRYFCPVGRTVGLYAQFSPVGIRVNQTEVCQQCHTLECYHGSQTSPPCPCHLVIGHMKDNQYCTSCGACQDSCPSDNVALGIRPLNFGLNPQIKFHYDTGIFVMIVLAVTSLHGLSMSPLWRQILENLSMYLKINFLWSFTLVMFSFIFFVFALLKVLSLVTGSIGNSKNIFTVLAISMLPLAFAYHLAHNLNHLSHDGVNYSQVLKDPLGNNPVSSDHQHHRQQSTGYLLYSLQSLFLILGFWFCCRILRSQLQGEDGQFKRWRLLPGLAFALLITLFNLWLMTQPMTMRMA